MHLFLPESLSCAPCSHPPRVPPPPAPSGPGSACPSFLRGSDVRPGSSRMSPWPSLPCGDVLHATIYNTRHFGPTLSIHSGKLPGFPGKLGGQHPSRVTVSSSWSLCVFSKILSAALLTHSSTNTLNHHPPSEPHASLPLSRPCQSLVPRLRQSSSTMPPPRSLPWRQTSSPTSLPCNEQVLASSK